MKIIFMSRNNAMYDAVVAEFVKKISGQAMNELEQGFEVIRNIKRSPKGKAKLPAVKLSDVYRVLRDVTELADRNICRHEETHRGGAIWEFCDQCGAKWADDRGGKPAFIEPKAITAAYAMLDKLDNYRTE